MSTLKIENLGKERARWLAQNLDEETVSLCRRNGIGIPKGDTGNRENWGDWRWHIKNRLSKEKLNDFLELFPEFKDREAELIEYLTSYDLSILPLNLLLKN